MLAALNRLADGYPLPNDDSTRIILQDTFAIVITQVNVSSFTGQALSALLGSSFDFRGISRENIAFTAAADATASISLPETLFDGLALSEAKLVYGIFLTSGLFLRREEYLQQNDLVNNTLGSIVIAAHIAGGIRISSLEQPVELMFLKDPVSQAVL